VVFGDIGTSPLYTLKTVLGVTGAAHPEPGAILGAVPLILWTRIMAWRTGLARTIQFMSSQRLDRGA
jgi:K+ transporter